MPTQVPTEIIHIDWEGPLTLDVASGLTRETDYGVYQIYGDHIIYGMDVLLYIGKAGRQTFGVRIPQESWPDHHDPGRIRVYVGRLGGETTPSDEDWERKIDLAERLLIYACYPSYNSQKNLGRLDPDLRNVHVLNWGAFGSLVPEASGARWTSRFFVMPDYDTFSTTDPRGVVRPPRTE